MKRLQLLLSAFFIVAFAIAAAARDQLPSAPDLHQAAGSRPAKVDGSLDPDGLPDAAALEIVFRLVSSPNENDAARFRKVAYLRSSGYGDAEASLVAAASFEFRRRIEDLDRKVMNIKDASWPNPGRDTIEQLTQLQHDKEALILEITDKLRQDLNRYDRAILRRHISEVKRHTKAFGTEADPPAARGAPAVRRCKSNLYVYSLTQVDLNHLVVYAHGSFSGDYDNCDHIYAISTTLRGPENLSSSGSYGATLSLEPSPGHLMDGPFSAVTNIEGYCPNVKQSVAAGNNASK